MKSDEKNKDITRRDFLGLSALGAFFCAIGLSLIGLIKLPFPALFPDVSKVFKIGKSKDFLVGGQKLLPEKKVLILRDEKGIYAISTVCTHLGCVVSITDSGFACPCHGSVFDNNGLIISGPASNLNWLEVSQLPSGVLAINANKYVPIGSRFIV